MPQPALLITTSDTCLLLLVLRTHNGQHTSNPQCSFPTCKSLCSTHKPRAKEPTRTSLSTLREQSKPQATHPSPVRPAICPALPLHRDHDPARPSVVPVLVQVDALPCAQHQAALAHWYAQRGAHQRALQAEGGGASSQTSCMVTAQVLTDMLLKCRARLPTLHHHLQNHLLHAELSELA